MASKIQITIRVNTYTADFVKGFAVEHRMHEAEAIRHLIELGVAAVRRGGEQRSNNVLETINTRFNVESAVLLRHLCNHFDKELLVAGQRDTRAYIRKIEAKNKA